MTFPSKQMVHAVRQLRMAKHPPNHVHEFVDDEPCPCGVTFDQALDRDTEPFVLELNPD